MFSFIIPLPSLSSSSSLASITYLFSSLRAWKPSVVRMVFTWLVNSRQEGYISLKCLRFVHSYINLAFWLIFFLFFSCTHLTFMLFWHRLFPKSPCLHFCISSQNLPVLPSGELKTSQPLDREEKDEYRFKVRVVDGGGRYCESDIHIIVEDVNDNPPQFSTDPYSITVFENTETGTFVAKLSANDLDTGEFYSLAHSR